jgi:hypothetical protein
MVEIDLMVILDNSTRWNSTYLSLHRALHLRPRIDLFCYEYREYLQEDSLNAQEWDHVKEIVQGLHIFHEVTLDLESNAKEANHGAVWGVLPALSVLLRYLEDGVNKYKSQAPIDFNDTPPASATRRQRQTQQQAQSHGPSIHPLAVAYQNAWAKLLKYYELTDEAHGIYGAALLLHPSYRKAFFERQWEGTEAQVGAQLIANVKKIWQDIYRQAPVNPSPTYNSTALRRFLQTATDTESTNDEFDSFIEARPTEFGDNNVNNVIDWVCSDSNRWPSLRQMMLDLLAIPAMSAELERQFSQAKLTLTATRNRLNDNSIEMLELLRQWWVGNVVAQQRGGGGRQYRKRQRPNSSADLNSEQLGNDDAI